MAAPGPGLSPAARRPEHERAALGCRCPASQAPLQAACSELHKRGTMQASAIGAPHKGGQCGNPCLRPQRRYSSCGLPHAAARAAQPRPRLGLERLSMLGETQGGMRPSAFQLAAVPSRELRGLPRTVRRAPPNHPAARTPGLAVAAAGMGAHARRSPVLLQQLAILASTALPLERWAKNETRGTTACRHGLVGGGEGPPYRRPRVSASIPLPPVLRLPTPPLLLA